MKKILTLFCCMFMIMATASAQTNTSNADARSILAKTFNDMSPVEAGPLTINGAKVVGTDVEVSIYLDESQIPMSMLKLYSAEMKKTLTDSMVETTSADDLAAINTNLLLKFIGKTTKETFTMKVTPADLREAEKRRAQ